MKYQHKKSKEFQTLLNIQNEFHKLRREDDDFARSYARHEFNKYLLERYVQCEAIEKEIVSTKFIKEYNFFREKIIHYIKDKGWRLKDNPHKMTADELIGAIQEIENNL